MEYLIFGLAVAGFIVAIMIKGYFEERKKKKIFIRSLYENFGGMPEEKEYSAQDLLRISKYFETHKNESFHVDDITWNDLRMDEIFSRMNYTYSAAGEEYLYHLLKSPSQNIKQLTRMEENILYFMEHEEERVQHQTAFASMGKTGKYSIYDYIKNLDLLGDRSNKAHYLGNLFLLFSVGLMFFTLQYGLLLLFIGLAQNIVKYYKEKGEIEPYIISFAYILRTIKAAENLEKIPCEALFKERENLKQCRKKMTKFRAGSYIVMSESRMSGSGNPLEIIFDYVRMMFHLDLIKFNQMLSEVRLHADDIDGMITDLGYAEAVIAIGAFRASLDQYCVPNFIDGKRLAAEELYHPLIHDPVKNSIDTKKGVLVTGSNASGKSTFLKTIAVNVILSQSIHTSMSSSYTAAIFRIFSSMSLRDDLAGGDSYYMVEIKSLKRILDNAKQAQGYLLCFVDEVLRGTNTVERIAASTQILKSLSRESVICFAATHDIELTHLLEDAYRNYHFEEDIIDGDVVFNYRLMQGRAVTRNAIKLLAMIGYEDDIIEDADRLAASFLKEGKWIVDHDKERMQE